MARIYADIQSITRRVKSVPNTVTPDSRISRAERLLKRVYAYSRSKASAQANVGSRSDVEELASTSLSFMTLSELTRLEDFVASCGWMMLAICVHSDGFIYATRHRDEDFWIDTLNCIIENERSIELFAKVRGLDWLSIVPADEREDGYCPRKDTREQIDVPADDPFHWYFSAEKDIKQPSFNGELQITVPQNIYHSDGDLNENPLMKILGQGPCLICNSTVGDCNCNTHTPSHHFHPPLVELTPCGIRGLGIRALQAIPLDTLLGEYVGEVYPATMPDEELAMLDYTYGLSMTPPGSVSPSLAVINAEKYGNWTRFINHSCRPSTEFFTGSISGRLGMFVRAIKHINIFEELTIDYGAQYFTRSKECACGEDCCRYDKKSKEAQKAMELDDSNDYDMDDADGDDDVVEGEDSREDSREYTEGDETGDDTGDIDSGPACQVIDTDIATGMKELSMGE